MCVSNSTDREPMRLGSILVVTDPAAHLCPAPCSSTTACHRRRRIGSRIAWQLRNGRRSSQRLTGRGVPCGWLCHVSHRHARQSRCESVWCSTMAGHSAAKRQPIARDRSSRASRCRPCGTHTAGSAQAHEQGYSLSPLKSFHPPSRPFLRFRELLGRHRPGERIPSIRVRDLLTLN
jgi:hypothetical protein